MAVKDTGAGSIHPEGKAVGHRHARAAQNREHRAEREDGRTLVVVVRHLRAERDRGERGIDPDFMTGITHFDTRIAEFALLPEEIDAMKAGASAEIIVVAATATETPVRLTLSLAGFTAAYGEFETLTAGLF